MPSIDDFKQKDLKKKKFKKTPYRPWNNSLSEDLKEPKKLSTENATNNEPIIYQNTTNYISKHNQNTTNNEPIIYQNTTNNESIVNRYIIDIQSDIQSKNENLANFPEEKNQLFINLRRLCGLQKNIVIYIVNKCIYNNSLCSGPIKTEDFVKYLNTDSFTIRTAIQRIQKKGFILKKEGKKGVGGFTIFYIESELKKLISEEIQEKFPSKNPLLNVTNNKPKIQPNPPTSSSSSSILTTTKEAVDNFFEDNFSESDIISLKKIGFSKNHLTQILKTGKLAIDDIRLSIQHFAFDLEENKKHEKINGSPLNYFMGILLKGIPYNAPENYEDPKKKALKAFVQRKEQELREIEELESKAVDLMYGDWVKTISEDLVAEVIPEPQYRVQGSPFREGSLKKYFKENVWPGFRS